MDILSPANREKMFFMATTDRSSQIFGNENLINKTSRKPVLQAIAMFQHGDISKTFLLWSWRAHISKARNTFNNRVRLTAGHAIYPPPPPSVRATIRQHSNARVLPASPTPPFNVCLTGQLQIGLLQLLKTHRTCNVQMSNFPPPHPHPQPKFEASPLRTDGLRSEKILFPSISAE